MRRLFYFNFPSFLLVYLVLLIPARAWPAIFYVPENGDTLVGQIQHVKAKKTDTLSEIAQRYDVGYNEIISANPDVDPWLPPEGVPILIPSRYVLPPKPWRGIVINLAEMRLFYFPDKKTLPDKPLVYSFPIGIGRQSWSTPVGRFHITEKIKDPVWTVPSSVLAEAASEGEQLPWQVPAGDDNPLGKYAMLLDEAGYMIHGTNKSAGVGRRVSHGCIRLYPEDIEQLIAQVPRGTEVRIIDQAASYGIADGILYIESNHDHDAKADNRQAVLNDLRAALRKNRIRLNRRESARSAVAVRQAFSFPVPIKDLQIPEDKASYALVVPKNETRSSRPGPVYSPMVWVKLIGKPRKVMNSADVAEAGLMRVCTIYNCYRYGPYASHDLAYAYSQILKYGFGADSYIIEESQ